MKQDKHISEKNKAYSSTGRNPVVEPQTMPSALLKKVDDALS